MPRRLRVAFPSTRAVRLACDCGTFTLTGRTATLRYTSIVHQPTTDSWAKLSGPAETYALTDTRAGPASMNGWWQAALIETTGDIFLAQGKSATGRSGTYYFRLATGLWEKVGGFDGAENWWKRSREGILSENYGACYDDIRHCVWWSPQTPIATYDPQYGTLKYDLATDEFYNWAPKPDCTYVPSTAEDAAHFIEARKGINHFREVDVCFEHINGYLYKFGAYNKDSSTAPLQILNITSAEDNPSLNIIQDFYYPAGPSWLGDKVLTYHVSGKHRRENYLWTFDRFGEFWQYNLNDRVRKWRRLVTIGDRPTWTDYPRGMSAELHEDANCVVIWCANAYTASGSGEQVDGTWVLDLSTLRYRRSVSAATGAVVGTDMPPGGVSVHRNLLYDPAARAIRAVTYSNDRIRVWSFQPEYTGNGTLTGLPLPTWPAGTTTVGDRYYGYPYTNNHGSKNTNMAYCPLDGRIYIKGGDVIGTASPAATWSLLPDGSIFDFEQLPSDIDPNPRYDQDGMGFAWAPLRNKFILWPGIYVQGGTTPTDAWAKGWWEFDPVSHVWTQHTNFWGTPGTGTGNDYGGAYDPATDKIYVVGDNSASRATKIFDLTAGTSATKAWANSSSWLGTTTPTAFYARGMQMVLNGYVYALGILTDGTTSGSYTTLMRWNITTERAELLAAPPVPAGWSLTKEMRLAASGNKIVWPACKGPEGDFPYGILVYDTVQDYWVADMQTPGSGNLIGNCVMHGSLPDGSVCFSGGEFGRQQTHFWKYIPAT